MTARIKRATSGKVDGLILSNARVWALPFARLPDEKAGEKPARKYAR